MLATATDSHIPLFIGRRGLKDGHVVYRYDSLHRLLSETISGDSQGGNGTISYTYSLAGNRMSRTSNVAGVSTVTDTYNANDELTGEVSGGVTTTYQYDSNGNTIQTSNGTTTTTFTYDSQNRLIKQNAGQPNEVDIVYDGAGSKVAETANGMTTKYLIDTNNPTGYSQIVEEIVNGAVTRRYTLGHWIISETQNISGTWTTSFYGYDGHNSVRFLTNSAGAVTDNYTFDAFGIKIAGTGTTPNQILYSGEYLDPGTGDYDLRAREYNQATGTFPTMDTTPGQLPYVYTSDNPVMFVDPSGDFGISDVTTSIAISLTIGNAVAFGAIGAMHGGGITGFTNGLIGGALVGGEAGLALVIGESEGRLPQVIAAGLLSGFTNDLVDISSRAILGEGWNPGIGQLYEDFASGFAGGAFTAAFKGAISGPIGGGLVTALISGIDQAIANVDSPHPESLSTVLVNSLVAGLVSGIVSGTLQVDALKRTVVSNFVEDDPTLARDLFNGFAGSFVAYSFGTVIKVAEGLI